MTSHSKARKAFTLLEFVVVILIIVVLVWILLPAVQPARGHDGRLYLTRGNLKQIGLAFFNYESEYLTFPDTAIRDDAGKPLLSWRVRLLPYLEQEELYNEFHLDEPWDSEHNKKLISRIPTVYRNLFVNEENYKTNLLLPVSVGGPASQSTMWDEGVGRKLDKITDGVSETIMLVTVAEDLNVIWTKPGDLPFNPEVPWYGLHTGDLPSVRVLMADGSVQILPREIKDEKVLSQFTCSGNDDATIDWEKLRAQ